jgi:stage II sporulation protein E
LQENDVLLFLSDGITAAFGSSTDLYEAVKTIPSTNPQELANSLLDKALTAYGNVAKDDMTVVAVRLFESIA